MCVSFYPFFRVCWPILPPLPIIYLSLENSVPFLKDLFYYCLWNFIHIHKTQRQNIFCSCAFFDWSDSILEFLSKIKGFNNLFNTEVRMMQLPLLESVYNYLTFEVNRMLNFLLVFLWRFKNVIVEKYHIYRTKVYSKKSTSARDFKVSQHVDNISYFNSK